MHDLIKEDWYNELIEELRAIQVEGIFDARQRVIEMHWQLGKRLLEEYENFGRKRIYGEEIVSRVSESLGCHSRYIYRSIQFVKKFPSLEDIGKLPEGKNLSWTKLVKNYLIEAKAASFECKHKWETIQKCELCGKIK